ncbi:dihydrodipicolinate synthase family protein [Acidisphaera sp. L21]|uniref:dihydrodipicolinate synthase family protein n=1 Tax=Acidisphaera sp. L21 TaxID=1641851 RepID=UPI00131AFAC5|nr:dihydrodipicolinate synthase family protein [Acidisphaera sp. L21]
MTDGIGGFWVATATPLAANGSVDHARLAEHGAWLFRQGVEGLVLFGTTGEGTSFSATERLETVSALLKAGVAPNQLALGTGFPAVPDTIALSKSALALGLQHMLILPPYFYRDASATGLEDAFAAIIEGVADDRLRATLYHIPQVSGVAIPPAVLANLRVRFGKLLAGVKDSSGNFEHFRAFRAAAPDVAVTIGNEVDIARALAEGGTGTICGMANLVPGMVHALFRDPAAAGPMQAAVDLMTGPFCPTLKAALAELTGEPAWSHVRPPLHAASWAEGHRVAAGLRALQQDVAA